MWPILITGTSRWIGHFLAQKYSKDYTVFWLSRTSSTIHTEKFHEFLWDINNTQFLEHIFQSIPEIDWLILNAGIWYFDMFEKISLEQYSHMIHTNLLSPLLLTKILFPKIKKGVIGIGSYAGKKSLKYGTWYAASKFGLRGFLLTLKNETPKKIHLINPKIVHTDFHAHAKIEIPPDIPKTDMHAIFDNIQNILQRKEHRFEIDI